MQKNITTAHINIMWVAFASENVCCCFYFQEQRSQGAMMFIITTYNSVPALIPQLGDNTKTNPEKFPTFSPWILIICLFRVYGELTLVDITDMSNMATGPPGLNVLRMPLLSLFNMVAMMLLVALFSGPIVEAIQVLSTFLWYNITILITNCIWSR